jgi:putative hemolysin
LEKSHELSLALKSPNSGEATFRDMLPAGLWHVFERLSALTKIRDIYKALPESSGPHEFLDNVLRHFQIEYEMARAEMVSIPTTGPLIVISNHPFGGIDGILLGALLFSVRPDVRIMTNFMLGAIPELRPIFIPVDPFGGKDAAAKNVPGLRAAVRWVRQGGLLLVFPAGEVSHLKLRERRVEDPKWNDSLAHLVRLARAPVLPVYFEGRNSNFFQAAGLIHPRVRTALLPREILKKQSTRIRLKIGTVVPLSRMEPIREDSALTTYLRFQTYMLRLTLRKSSEKGAALTKPPAFERRLTDLASAQPPALLMKEVGMLPSAQMLAKSGDLYAYEASATQIPGLLREIGRLREETFRNAGEGTGKAIDLDRFDRDYIHLFVWNQARSEVVGAYRMGPTDRIVPGHGKSGLYTHTLFKYGSDLLAKMGPALELGRSFVRPEYQKDYAPLLLLWKAIGSYVARRPWYRVLFGAVSITRDYGDHSRHLMAEFLRGPMCLSHLSGLVKPRRAFKQKILRRAEKELVHRWLVDIETLSSSVSLLEPDRKGVPILLKQYLKLGGKLMGLTEDRKFGNTLDGLIMVDLVHTSSKVLRRYMGEEGYRAFMAYHDKGDSLPFLAASNG